MNSRGGYLSEKELEDLIFIRGNENMRRGLLSFDHQFWYRQVGFSEFGVMDILGVTIDNVPKKDRKFLGYNRTITLTIYELKVDVVNTKTLFQALKYLNGLKNYILHNHHIRNTVFEYKICLVGTYLGLDMNLEYIADSLEGVDVYLFDNDSDDVDFVKHSNIRYVEPNWPVKHSDNLSFLRDRFKEIYNG